MDLKQYTLNLFGKQTNITNTRQEVLGEIIEEINNERVGTKHKPISAKAVAIKVSHLSESELRFVLSEGRDYKNRRGSFGKYFFGALKVK